MSMFRVGEALVNSALELELTGRPIGSLGASTDLVNEHRWWLEPYFLEAGDTWSLNFRSWIVEVDDKVIVIDPCNGNGRPNPIPMFDMLDIPFLERFEATGTRVEDVDFVFCTHMHHDHCGWNTMLRDGKWVPTFPNARYLFLQREYDRWRPENASRFKRLVYNDGTYERSVEPVVAAGQADLVLDRYQVSQSLRIEQGSGHTDGHSMLHLSSSGAEAMFCGDAIHHPLQLVEPTVCFGDHDDWQAVMETRRQLVRHSLEREMLLVPAHLPRPHAGQMRQDPERGLWFEAMQL